MANDAGRVRESLQSVVDQPLAPPAQPRRDDRCVAETVNSPVGGHRPQWLQSSLLTLMPRHTGVNANRQTVCIDCAMR